MPRGSGSAAAAPDLLPPAREEMIRRARALAPKLKERAAETERLRRIHPDTVRDFHQAGLWRVHQPARVGGFELDYALYVDIGEEIGRACGSSAWVWANLASHHWMLGMFPRRAQDEVWGADADALIGSALVYPCGAARPAAGGYRLSGRWPFSSGIDPSDWVMLGGMVPADREGDPAAPRIFVVRKSALEVIDTWDVVGLVGTGSHDVRCADLFVPAHLTLDPRAARGGPTPGSAANPHPLYRLPVLALFPHILAGPILGMARGAYDEQLETVRSRSATYNASRLAEHANLHLRIAEAAAKIEAARLLLRNNCAEAKAIAEAAGVPDDDSKSRWRRDGAFAVRLSVEAVGVIHAAAGGGANYRRSGLQRHFRDVHAAAAHIAVSWDVNGAEFGRVAVGLPLGNPNV